MNTNTDIMSTKLISVVVNYGIGNKILKSAKDFGVLEGTIIQGIGTVENKSLAFLGLRDARKEIILMVAPPNLVETTISSLLAEFEFESPDSGICFTVNIPYFFGAKQLHEKTEATDKHENIGGMNKDMYRLIMTIVDKGKSSSVMNAAKSVGARGGTVISGRGSGIHESHSLLAFEIEPEKEIIMILSKKEDAEKIVGKIREEMDIDDPGTGIVFVQNVDNAYGIY